MDGLLLIDKPGGMTSHDVVDAIRRRLQIRKVGHGGTLDPSATGLLILLLGKATRKASDFLQADKTYRATLRLGVATDTQDSEGRVIETRPVEGIPLEKVHQVLSRFMGSIEQQIPAYSAVHIQGRRSYALARAGIAPPPRTRRVTVHTLKLLDVQWPDLDLEVTCSTGTYVRTLCSDIGAALGTGGHLAALRRTRIGTYTVAQAVPLDRVEAHHALL